MAMVLDTRTTCLRAWRLTSWKLSTAQSLPSRASYTTINKTPKSVQPCSHVSSPRRQITLPTIRQRVQLSFSKSRFASSSASASLSSTSAANQLTWDRFFDLRKKRRYINLVASIATAAGSVVIAGPLLAAQDVDTWGAQITGIDPVFVLGASTLAVGAVGWLCGPTFGNLVFRGWAGRRGWNNLIAQKEKSFYARIKRYRADPSSSSPQNPIPDYYGEKIASVKDYRRWLKDQKAFNLKKDKNML